MSREFVVKLAPWIPVVMAAVYFVFLFASWSQFVREQQRQQKTFDEKLEAWISERGRDSSTD